VLLLDPDGWEQGRRPGDGQRNLTGLSMQAAMIEDRLGDFEVGDRT
jgi:hypothetical protein